MKKLKWFLLVGLIPIVLPFLLIIILAVATAGSPTIPHFKDISY